MIEAIGRRGGGPDGGGPSGGGASGGGANSGGGASTNSAATVESDHTNSATPTQKVAPTNKRLAALNAPELRISP